MAAIPGYGTKIEYGPASETPSYSVLADPREVEVSFGERMTLDASNLTEGFMTTIGGRVQPGEIVVSVNFKDSTHAAFIADLDDTTTDYYAMKITVPRSAGEASPTGTIGPFPVFLRSITHRITPDDVMVADCRFQIVRPDSDGTTA